MSARRSRGDGALFQRANGLWVATVELGWSPDGRRLRKYVTSKTQSGALAKLRAVRREVERGRAVPTSSPTLEAWLERWLADIAAPRVKPRTLDTYRDKVRLIVEAIGRKRLDKLTPADVRAMHRHAAADGRSSTTALHCHRVLSTALRDAERDVLVARNVCELVDAPRKAVTEQKVLTAEEARKALLRAAREPYGARWALALLYGCRQAEALGLRVVDVDFERRTIALDWQLQRLTYRHGCSPACGRKRGADCPRRHFGLPAGYEVEHLVGAWHLTRPKREKRRVLPLIDVVAEALRVHLASSPPSPHGLVFARADGAPLSPTEDATAWHELLERAEVPDVKLHDARHTTATLLLEAGVDVRVVQAILGHSTAAMTRRYQEVDLDLARRAVEGLGRELTSE